MITPSGSTVMKALGADSMIDRICASLSWSTSVRFMARRTTIDSSSPAISGVPMPSSHRTTGLETSCSEITRANVTPSSPM